MSGDSLTTSERRSLLQWYARRELGGDNQAQAFLNIVATAIQLAETVEEPLFYGADPAGGVLVAPAHDWIDDLQAVLVGNDLREGRNHGPHYVGNQYIHVGPSTGFKPELHIDSRGISEAGQVQHAAAALIIAYKYGRWGEAYALGSEDQAHDKRLYEAIFPLVTFWSFSVDDLPAKLLEAICDTSCTLPPIGGPLDTLTLMVEWGIGKAGLAKAEADSDGDGIPDMTLAPLVPEPTTTVDDGYSTQLASPDPATIDDGYSTQLASPDPATVDDDPSSQGDLTSQADYDPSRQGGDAAAGPFNMEQDAAAGPFNMEQDAAAVKDAGEPATPAEEQQASFPGDDEEPDPGTEQSTAERAPAEAVDACFPGDDETSPVPGTSGDAATSGEAGASLQTSTDDGDDGYGE
jgi:hypothetical protein